MTAAIRPATEADLPGIAAVASAAFGEPIEEAICRRHIADPAIDLHVAVHDGAVVGFVSAFAVADAEPWYVDSLAVHPQHHNRGHGRRLVESTFATGRRLGFARSVALIRIDNTPSQRCFARCGYASDGRPHDLYIWERGEADATAAPTPVRLLPVDTITYRGVWLQGLPEAAAADQRQAIAAAHALCLREDRGLSGALVADAARLDDAVRAAAAPQGQYHYWEKTL